MIESFVNGMLMEMDWLNIMLIIIGMIKRVMCLVVNMVRDSLVFMVTFISMVIDWHSSVSHMMRHFMKHRPMEDCGLMMDWKIVVHSFMKQRLMVDWDFMMDWKFMEHSFMENWESPDSAYQLTSF